MAGERPCIVCFCTGEIALTATCGHFICIHCVRNFIGAAKTPGKDEQCPNNECGGSFTYSDIRAYMRETVGFPASVAMDYTTRALASRPAQMVVSSGSKIKLLIEEIITLAYITQCPCCSKNIEHWEYCVHMSCRRNEGGCGCSFCYMCGHENGSPSEGKCPMGHGGCDQNSCFLTDHPDYPNNEKQAFALFHQRRACFYLKLYFFTFLGNQRKIKEAEEILKEQDIGGKYYTFSKIMRSNMPVFGAHSYDLSKRISGSHLRLPHEKLEDGRRLQNGNRLPQFSYEEGAKLIQSLWRAFIGKQHYRNLLGATLFIQMQWRRSIPKRKRICALRIQVNWRGFYRRRNYRLVVMAGCFIRDRYSWIYKRKRPVRVIKRWKSLLEIEHLEKLRSCCDCNTPGCKNYCYKGRKEGIFGSSRWHNTLTCSKKCHPVFQEHIPQCEEATCRKAARIRGDGKGHDKFCSNKCRDDSEGVILTLSNLPIVLGVKNFIKLQKYILSPEFQEISCVSFLRCTKVKFGFDHVANCSTGECHLQFNDSYSDKENLREALAFKLEISDVMIDKRHPILTTLRNQHVPDQMVTKMKSILTEQYVKLKQRRPFLTNNLWCELYGPKSKMASKRLIPDDWRFKILTEKPSRSIALANFQYIAGAEPIVIIPLPVKFQAKLRLLGCPLSSIWIQIASNEKEDELKFGEEMELEAVAFSEAEVNSDSLSDTDLEAEREALATRFDWMNWKGYNDDY